MKQAIIELPLPPAISDAALSEARKEASTGIVAAYDSSSLTGALLDLSLGRLIWRAWAPITSEEFAKVVNSLPDLTDGHILQ